VFHSQLKRRAQFVRETQQTYAKEIDHLAHGIHVELPEHLISKEAAHVFGDGLRERDIKRQLLLGGGGGRKTFSEALNQALELEAANTADGTSSTCGKRRPEHFERASPQLPNRMKRLPVA
jgi:hypothetical protein